MSVGKTVWVVGATGLVGRETVSRLLADPTFSRVVAIVRTRSGIKAPRFEEKLVDFSGLEQALAGSEVDVAICCLGTTIKRAGSPERFREVDYDYAMAFARAALAAHVQHLLVVTAIGANARSKARYNRVKGELEQSLAKLSVPQLTIVRPSLLIGERAEVRIGERLLAPFSRILPARYRGIRASTVAQALVRLARESTAPRRLVDSAELHELGA